MTTIEELYNEAIEHWRLNKGVGTAIIPKPLDDKYMVLGVLQRIYSRSPNMNVIILTNYFNERTELIEFLTNQEDEENDNEFKNLIDGKILKVFSSQFVQNAQYPLRPTFVILYHYETMDDKVVDIMKFAKFKLVVLNKLMPNVEDMRKLYYLCPLLNEFKQNEIDQLRVSTPVEDEWIGIDIPDNSEDKKLLDYLNDYIATSINIFGSFEVIQQARTGNPQFNLSAMQICQRIAHENGWSEHLDMSISINEQIDELYSPSSLHDRASQTYEKIRLRTQLLCDYSGKLDKILEIINENSDKKILVISKRGEFASKVTEFVNTMSETIICGNYHDKAEPVPAVDINGKPIFYKSGPRKGERRMMAAQMQKTLNEKLFNSGKLRVLSANNSIDKDLCIDVDVIIITSPICDSIESFMYRLSNLHINNNRLKLYSIFVNNSLELSKLESKEPLSTHIIVNNCKKSLMLQNNSEFIVVD